jgi:hypothetical protein
MGHNLKLNSVFRIRIQLNVFAPVDCVVPQCRYSP